MLERLQKIISRAGIASRRHAEQLILSGQVRVNGCVVTELGTKADPERDRIEAAGRTVRMTETRVYLLLHKPPQVVSTLADPEGRTTVQDLLRGLPARVFPVGRLDYAASGLLLLTNDGDLADRLLKAAAHLSQVYWVKVKGRLSEDQIHEVSRQVRARVRPLKAPLASRGRAANAWYEVSLSGARRDLLRRTLTLLGHPAEKLKRVRLANLDLEGLPEGRYRHLEKAERAGLVRLLRPSAERPARPEATAAREKRGTARPLRARGVRPSSPTERDS
jgi:23S rRNA pseudouridine2605 synthase